MDIAAYVADAEKFVSRLTAEYYRHGAGLKEDLDLSRIYEEHRALFAPGAVASLVDDRSTPERRMFAEFAAFGWIENELRGITDQIGTAEARSTVAWDGKALPWRQASIAIADEQDRIRRQDLEQRTAETTAQSNPQREVRLRRSHDLAAGLGFPDYVALCEQLGQLDLAALNAEMQRLLAGTEAPYVEEMTRRLSDAGIPAADATTADWALLRRGHEFDAIFPKDKLLAALERTMLGIGIDIGRQQNLRLDVEDRPLKSPRAFCAPIRVPHEVWLVIRPRGGHDDYNSIMHEAGHAEHFAHTRPDAPFAFRYLGDNSVTEAYAFLFANLIHNPIWLQDMLGAEDFSAYLSLAHFAEIYMLRRYAAKLGYELELQRSDEPARFPQRYAEVLGAALHVRVRPENFLYDLDDAFYCARYLRAWIAEVQLRRRLQREFGRRWYASAEAGEYLRSLWSLGQQFSAEEMAARLGYEGLEVEGVVKELLSQPGT
jgi:hypothetical protein